MLHEGPDLHRIKAFNLARTPRWRQNRFFRCVNGCGVESWSTLARAQGAARMAAEFYGRHGVALNQVVLEIVPGIGFVHHAIPTGVC